MRTTLLLLGLALGVSAGDEAKPSRLVLVELFTSQG